MNWIDILDALLWAVSWGTYDPQKEQIQIDARRERWEAFKKRRST